MSGVWKVIIPQGSRNYVLSPVAQGPVVTTYLSEALATITLDTTYAYLGCKNYKIVGTLNNQGIALVLSALSNNIHYVTVRTYGAIADWDWSLDNATFTAPTLLGIEGSWYVYGITFPAAQATGSTHLYIHKLGNAAFTWYLGHIQVESAVYATTYTTPITGDIRGFTSDGYKWEGSAHASSSWRSSQERSGGLEVDLDTTYNFKVLYPNGIGMPPIQHHIQGMALLPGALYQGHKVLPRVIDLISGTKANTTTTVATARKNFINAIKPDRVVPEQPVVFRYYGNANRPVEFYAYYDSGMEFQISSGVVDKPSARFICYDPFCYEVHTEAKVLERFATVADADYIVRKTAGTWYNVSTEFNNWVIDIIRGKDGMIYIGGSFTNVGAATGDNIVRWNPYKSTLISLTGGTGSGTDLAVYKMARASNGDIYIGGLFTAAGGIGATNNIAYWDVSATEFVTVGGGITAAGHKVEALAFGLDGSLYIGGSFHDQFDADGDYITKWNGTAYSSLGTGMDNEVNDLVIAPNGDLYATGLFHLAGGVADTLHIARWGTNDPTPAWHPLGTGLDGFGVSLAVNAAGEIYVSGTFDHADGVDCHNIAKWNGKTFEPLGSGINEQANVLVFDKYDQLYAGGFFTIAGGVSTTDKIATWNGSTWNHLDIDLPGAPNILSVLPVEDDIYIGYDTAGSAIASYTNYVPVANTGSHTVYPVFKIYRADDGTSAKIKWLRNETTKQTIRCDYDLQKGETLTIDFTPGDRSVTSDAPTNPRGGPVDVWRAVLRGSDLGTFGMIGGTNYISVYCAEVGAPTVTAWLEWRTTHWAADTAV